ncbi:hypothetical protein DV711_04145 [Motiliproteus coralliicola]|uniref:HPr-rel-A system PqqD family peptide chaperone n=1 Tax=Motiliproteus coralliicola TaxID=2283196 RepID=A0A369WSW7_9GAMM|nr:hypothetical protein DV711_04145 [Motiliproteus coralliicola]
MLHSEEPSTWAPIPLSDYCAVVFDQQTCIYLTKPKTTLLLEGLDTKIFHTLTKQGPLSLEQLAESLESAQLETLSQALERLLNFGLLRHQNG